MPQVSDYVYVYSTKHIDKVLEKIKTTGRPEKLTTAYLRDTWLLKNAQYSAVLDLLKKMDFLDDSGVPTDNYSKFQNSTIRNETLVLGIKNAYQKLFKAYPNAQDLPREDLKGYFMQHTGAAKSVVTKLVTTFTHICSKADFNSVSDGKSNQNGKGKNKKNDSESQETSKSIGGLNMSMNIQIVIPSDASAEQYDKIFSSIKKHFS